jgi:hypothetical protein
MADEKPKGEICYFSARKVDNGWSISFTYENKDQTLSQRAGWVPCSPCGECKEFVEKTKDAVIKRIKDCL